MKRITYRREYDITIVETYEVDVPEHLLDEDNPNELDVHITSNFAPDHEDRQGMVEDSLVMSFTVLGDGVSDQSRHPNHQRIIDELTADPAPLIDWAATEIVALGAKSEWDMEDNFSCTETLVGAVATHYGLPSGGDQSDEALRFYGEAARALGFRTDLDDESIGGPR